MGASSSKKLEEVNRKERCKDPSHIPFEKRVNNEKESDYDDEEDS